MNTSGCTDGFGRDDLLVANYPAQCTFILPLYIVLVIASTSILFGVALKRSLSIFKKPRVGLNPFITLTQSWFTVLNVLLFAVIPFTHQSKTNILCFLLGTLLVLFGISADQWMAKLLRLGGQIIGKKPANDEVYRHLDKLDWILTILIFSFRLVLALQLIFTVLALIDPNWIRVVLGAEAYIIFTCMSVLVYQYQRCKNVIQLSKANVKGLVQNGNRDLDLVLRKFNGHQCIVLGVGIPSFCLHLLWAIGVIPVNYAVILVVMCSGALVSSAMFLTFTCYSIKTRPIAFTITSAVFVPNQFRGSVTT